MFLLFLVLIPIPTKQIAIQLIVCIKFFHKSLCPLYNIAHNSQFLRFTTNVYFII